MIPEGSVLDLKAELQALAEDVLADNPHASVHLARLIEADRKGVFGPYAHAVGARLNDHVARCCEMCQGGVSIGDIDFQDEAYQLMKLGAIDWDGFPCTGRPGEEG